MKTKPRSKKLKRDASKRRDKSILSEPSAVTASKPAGPPLQGDALEQKVAEVLCQRFRRSDDRAKLRIECQGAEDPAIEAAIISSRVQDVVRPVAKASSLEHAIAVLQLILFSAKAALENEKPTTAQITALKIFVEILVVFLEGIELKVTGFEVFLYSPALFLSRSVETIVSTSDPQLPQLGHLPAQPTCEYPHCWQIYLE